MALIDIVKKNYRENDNSLCFKTTPIAKVIILSVITCGFYDIILTLNYWKTLKENFGYKVSPFWRGVFCVFTNFSLFPIFAKYFENLNLKPGSATGLAVLYLLCTWINNKISFRTALQSDVNIVMESITWVLCLVSALIFAFIQNKINKINEVYYPNAPKNPWKVSNIIWILICIVFWVLAYLPA